MIDLCKEPETNYFPSRQRMEGLEEKSFVVLDVEEATGRPRLVAALHVAPNPRIGLFVANNPVNWIDPLGLETAVQIGMGTGWRRNPLGHTAIATSGQGVHSFGTTTPQGSSFSDYLTKQAGYRDSMVYVLPTTPEQEKAINDYLNSLKDDLPPVPGEDSKDNCASRTSDALNKAGLNVGSNPTPAQLQRALEKMVKDGNALRFSVPKGSSPSDAWQTFNPR